jgi:hypothetical protein
MAAPGRSETVAGIQIEGLLHAGDFNRSMQHIDQIVQLVF